MPVEIATTGFSRITLVKLLTIVLLYLLAWLFYRLSGRIAGRFVRMSRLAPLDQRPRPERQEMLRGLFSGVITFVAFAAATLGSLSLFVDAATLVWMVGLFSAAFGLGARPLVSDFLTGLSLIFANTFEVGEKVELPGVSGGTIEGVVEAVSLRATSIRAGTGEPYSVPNGEIRVVRNFSRGRFSTANVKLHVAAGDLARALTLLESLGEDAFAVLPNLLEPWHVISESGEIGQQTELTLLARARFGNAAEMRPRLLAYVQEALSEAGIELA